MIFFKRTRTFVKLLLNARGWLGIEYYNDSFFDDKDRKYSVTGYPMDKEIGTMWYARRITQELFDWLVEQGFIS